MEEWLDEFKETKNKIEKLKHKHNIKVPIFLLKKGRYTGACIKNKRKAKVFLMYESLSLSFHAVMYRIDMSFDDYVEFILLHEYGHAVCSSSLNFVKRIKKIERAKHNIKNMEAYNQITKNMIISNEQKAWDIARKMIDKEKIRIFNQVERKYMVKYHELLSTNK